MHSIGKRENTNKYRACCSAKGKGRESDGEVANWDKRSRKVFLTRRQLNRAKRRARAKRTPVGRDTKATWVAGPQAGVHLVCWSKASLSAVQGVQERQVACGDL